MKLQYPVEGNQEDKRVARRHRAAMMEVLRASIDAGDIEVVICKQTVPVFEVRTDWDGIEERHRRALEFGVSESWLERDQAGALPKMRVQVCEEIREVIMIARQGAAHWLRHASIVPSLHVQGWLSQGSDEETMQKRREAVLQEWLHGEGKVYLEREKLTLTGPEAWEQLAKINREIFRAAAPSTIEEFFKNQKLIKRKQGRKPKHP